MVAYNVSGEPDCAHASPHTPILIYRHTVDDSSPLITYAGSWLDTPANDTLAANYTWSSLHTTAVPGASVSFSFNGTGIWFYGGHRPGYGNYTLSVDGRTVADGSASAANPVFDQLLGGSSNLTSAEHTAVLASLGGGPVDLDYLVFEGDIGSGNRCAAFVDWRGRIFTHVIT